MVALHDNQHKRDGVYLRSPEERMWERVTKGEGCWECSLTPSRTYPQVWIDGKSVSANRVAWELACGSIPEGFFVLHSCDNPRCVRNDDEGWYEINGILRPRRGHLWLGTLQENMEDRDAKGRTAVGERNGKHTKPERTAYGDRNGSRTHIESRPRGEENALAVLTEDAVREIRRRYAARAGNGSSLGTEYGVSPSTIYRVVQRRGWAHVSD